MAENHRPIPHPYPSVQTSNSCRLRSLTPLIPGNEYSPSYYEPVAFATLGPIPPPVQVSFSKNSAGEGTVPLSRDQAIARLRDNDRTQAAGEGLLAAPVEGSEGDTVHVTRGNALEAMASLRYQLQATREELSQASRSNPPPRTQITPECVQRGRPRGRRRPSSAPAIPTPPPSTLPLARACVRPSQRSVEGRRKSGGEQCWK
jgi:hypothetical protein